MKRFWDTVTEPILQALRPRSILEIGSDEGFNTRLLLDFCAETDAVLHVVDPVPKYDVSELEEQYGERFVFYQALSLDVVPRVGHFDAVLIDGDHNWYTVYNELKLIERRSVELSQPFPLVLLHDVSWPYGRRDLYYDPENIPEDYRHPYAQRGMRPGTAELLEEGGMLRHLHNAVREGGPRNGVFTAVEDYLRETDERLDLLRVPGFHGIGILAPPRLREDAKLAEILDAWDLPPAVARHAERVEAAWLQSEVHRHEQLARLEDLNVKLKDLNARREEHVEFLRNNQARTVERLRAKQAEVKELRQRLAEAEKGSSTRR